jgi:hypothetical protein
MIPQDASADVNGGGWATGGTKSMTGNYPDPFAMGVGNVCMLTCSSILGPCYAKTLERRDMSEGHDGLPVRLSFLILDEACKPLPGVSIATSTIPKRSRVAGFAQSRLRMNREERISILAFPVGTRVEPFTFT